MLAVKKALICVVETVIGMMVLGMMSAAPVDLTKIERHIITEPTYQSKAPKYCLVVFGREAQTRRWLVLDGDILYADRNGNGNLTDKGEQIKPTPFRKVVISQPQEPPPMERDFIIGNVVEADSKIKHTRLIINHRRWGKENTYSANVLNNVHPIADIEFPPQNPSRQPIKMRVVLDDRC